MGLFDGQVVIVTGAGGGIGRAEALAFAAEGARVVVNDLGVHRDGAGLDASAANAVVEEIRAAGGDAVASVHGVHDLDGADGIVWTAVSRFGRIDVVVNNAGILRDRALLNMSVAEWDAVVDVHLKGTFLVTRATARQMRAQGPGAYAIVNTTSMSGLRGNFGQANYGAAKAGVFGFTRTASLELAKIGCRVNAIAPVARTRMTDDLAVMQAVSVDEMGPAHVAPVALWLASSLAQDVNGRVFGVHGAHVFEYAMAQSAGIDGAPGGAPWTPQTLAAARAHFELPPA